MRTTVACFAAGHQARYKRFRKHGCSFQECADKQGLTVLGTPVGTAPTSANSIGTDIGKPNPVAVHSKPPKQLLLPTAPTQCDQNICQRMRLGHHQYSPVRVEPPQTLTPTPSALANCALAAGPGESKTDTSIPLSHTNGPVERASAEPCYQIRASPAKPGPGTNGPCPQHKRCKAPRHPGNT